MLGFFSFTEVTDPSAHEAYNAWHQLDHLPEQFTIEGITFGQRWVRSPRCREAETAGGTLLDAFHYMTLYLMRDESSLPEFFALARRLWAEDRFFKERRALLSGPYAVVGRWAAPRVAVSAAAVPFRPSNGVYAVVGPAVDGATLVACPGVAGVWQFEEAAGDADDVGTARARVVTVAFVDGDLWRASEALASATADLGGAREWAGPLERVDAFRWDWFATLTPQ